MVGGAGNFQNSPWNRALSPHTSGSAFKPFVYLTGIISGAVQPDMMIEDSPLAVPMLNGAPYSPKNFDGQFLGPITIRKALALSRNTCAVRVGQLVGADKIIDVARQAGINSELDPTPALSLGAGAVSPLEMASAYSTLARGGVRMQPQFMRRITRINGELVKVYNNEQVRVFSQEPVAELVDILQDVVEKGTATHARLFGRPVAGKTGTADGARDIWFVGFTPDLVTAVWGGNDQDRPIAGKYVTGGTIMAGIWQDYMRSYYNSHPVAPGSFLEPEHPFIVEPEPMHFLPSPAGIYDTNGGPGPNGATEMPPFAPQRSSHKKDDEHHAPKHKGGIGKFIKKLFDWF
jgi:penicillin-binding protein 1A